MKESIFLIFDRTGIQGMRKSIPPLKAGQYAVRLDVSVDDKYFNRIIPIAKMEVSDKFLIEPKIEIETIPKEVLEEEKRDFENAENKDNFEYGDDDYGR